MPYAFVRELRGVSADEFDRLRAELGDDSPPGLILHAAGPADGGWRTIEVWETHDDFDRYEREQVGPALERSGLECRRSGFEMAVHHLLR